MGVRVGHGAESGAQFYLKHQGEIEDVLRFLVHWIDRTPEPIDHGNRQPASTRKAASDL